MPVQPDVTSNEIRRANESLLQALLPHANFSAALALRQYAEGLERDGRIGNGPQELPHADRVAGALRLAAEVLARPAECNPWRLASETEFARLEREAFKLT